MALQDDELVRVLDEIAELSRMERLRRESHELAFGREP